MIVYAVIDSRDEPVQHAFGDVLDLHLDRQAAERELRDIVGDEPDWLPYLSVVEIELAGGGRN